MSETLNPTDEAFHDIANDGVAGHDQDKDGPVDISVVLPFCNERENLPELLDRLAETLQSAQLSYELILVDDGSTDGGVTFLEEQARSDERIKVLVLSRNFGQHIAATAGIDAAGGSMVVWMDSDLQEHPEDIPRLVAKHREGFDVVYARRKRRQKAPLRAAISQAFMRLLNRLAGLDVHPNLGCMRLFSSNVADSLCSFEERNRFLGYLMAWAGYRSAEIEVEVDPRRHGRTNYSWVSLVKLGLKGLTSFSVAPLRLSTLCSVLAMLACVVGVLWVLYQYFFLGIGVSGWASLIIALLALQAMQFAVLAMIGEYVGLTYTETKRRPLYFCSRMINLAPPAAMRREIGGAGALENRGLRTSEEHVPRGRCRNQQPIRQR